MYLSCTKMRGPIKFYVDIYLTNKIHIRAGFVSLTTTVSNPISDTCSKNGQNG